MTAKPVIGLERVVHLGVDTANRHVAFVNIQQSANMASKESFDMDLKFRAVEFAIKKGKEAAFEVDLKWIVMFV